MIGSVSSNFSDMVIIGERLESGIRTGEITHNSANTSNPHKPFPGFAKKKEGETNAISGLGKASYTNHPQTFQFPAKTLPASHHQASQSYRPQNYPERKHAQFDPIPMSYSNRFCHLICHNLITPRPMRPLQPPFPRGYDPNVTCEFHSGAVGHSIENCNALKYVVQDLIESKWLNFKEDGLNVATNPLPGHGKPSTSAT